MPRPRLPHLARERTRHGLWVWYVRQGKGPRIRIRAEYGSPEFMASYHAALDGREAGQLEKPGRDSLAWLIARYRESSAWALLSPATRYQRETTYVDMTDRAGAEPYNRITARVVREAIERRVATPFAANNFLKAVRGLFGWAREAELIDTNPAAEVSFLPIKTEGHEPWTPDDVRRFEARWPTGSRERIWLHVLLYTGLRLGDACTVGHQHVRDGWIALKAEKTGVALDIPILPPLAATLAAGGTGDLAFIANHHGRPFVKEAFGNAFRRAAREAGVNGKSAHGLRKALAGMAAEAGASEEELKALFGWTSNRMSAVYTRGASRKRMAGAAAEKIMNAFGPHLVSGAGRNMKKCK